jgi:hypothetical protein
VSGLGIAGLGLVLLTVVLMGVFAFVHRRSPPVWRAIPALTRLRHAVGLSVEDGTRLHFSLGYSSPLEPSQAASLAALSLMRQVSERTSLGDRPPVATAGEGALAVLAQDTLRSAHLAAGVQEPYDSSSGRLAGLTPFSYITGTLPVMKDEQVSANLLVGHFGPEAALLAEVSERGGAFTLAATDDLTAQAVFYAASQEVLIGEELFASGAYFQAGPLHHASLRVQDILRWVIIILLLASAALTLVGVL